MTRKLLCFPLRAGIGVARMTLEVTTGAAKLAASAIGFAPRSSRSAPPQPVQRTTREAAPWREPAAPPSPAPPSLAPSSAAPAPRAPISSYARAAPEPGPTTPLDPSLDAIKTVDDEPEVVAEFAEPGAEDGAGAQVVVEQPWHGYREMHADAVIARIAEASPEEVAVVELYEQAHKQRQTVLAAAERRLRTSAG